MNKNGFTLVELSIVLVIIGLLIGGILVAQSMIGTAKITAFTRQVQQADIAVRILKPNIANCRETLIYFQAAIIMGVLKIWYR